MGRSTIDPTKDDEGGIVCDPGVVSVVVVVVVVAVELLLELDGGDCLERESGVMIGLPLVVLVVIPMVTFGLLFARITLAAGRPFIMGISNRCCNREEEDDDDDDGNDDDDDDDNGRSDSTTHSSDMPSVFAMAFRFWTVFHQFPDSRLSDLYH